MAKKQDQKKSKIEEMPEETRRLIFWSTIIFFGVVIIGIWIFSFKLTIEKTQLQLNPEEKTLEELQKQLQQILDETTKGFEDIRQDFDQSVENFVRPTTTAQVDLATSTASTSLPRLTE